MLSDSRGDILLFPGEVELNFFKTESLKANESGYVNMLSKKQMMNDDV